MSTVIGWATFPWDVSGRAVLVVVVGWSGALSVDACEIGRSAARASDTVRRMLVIQDISNFVTVAFEFTEVARF